MPDHYQVRDAEFREARDDDDLERSHALCPWIRGRHKISFARKRDASTVEEITIRTLLEVGEEAHPDKTERMVAGVRKDELPEGFSETVRFLGPWIDMSGGCVTDTATRLEKAREVWRKVKVKLPMLAVGLRARARVVQATVVATLLFGAEIRTFSRKDIEKYRKFLGGVIRYISYNKATGEGTMRGMQGNTTTTDLRLKAGLEDVQTQIIQRQARYIGHVARYKDTRIERVVLGISSADKKEEGGLRGMYWQRVSEVMEQLRYPEHEWSEKWIEVARDRKSWKQGVSEVVKEYKQEFDYDTWENRHTEQNTSYEREVRQAIEELDDQGRACCPRCGGWQYNIRVHLSRCRPPEDLPPRTPEGSRLRPREGSKSEKTQCGACGKWRSTCTATRYSAEVWMKSRRVQIG